MFKEQEMMKLANNKAKELLLLIGTLSLSLILCHHLIEVVTNMNKSCFIRIILFLTLVLLRESRLLINPFSCKLRIKPAVHQLFNKSLREMIRKIHLKNCKNILSQQIINSYIAKILLVLPRVFQET